MLLTPVFKSHFLKKKKKIVWMSFLLNPEVGFILFQIHSNNLFSDPFFGDRLLKHIFTQKIVDPRTVTSYHSIHQEKIWIKTGTNLENEKPKWWDLDPWLPRIRSPQIWCFDIRKWSQSVSHTPMLLNAIIKAIPSYDLYKSPTSDYKCCPS